MSFEESASIQKIKISKQSDVHFFCCCFLEEYLRELVRRKECSWRGKSEREEKVSDEERKWGELRA